MTHRRVEIGLTMDEGQISLQPIVSSGGVNSRNQPSPIGPLRIFQKVELDPPGHPELSHHLVDGLLDLEARPDQPLGRPIDLQSLTKSMAPLRGANIPLVEGMPILPDMSGDRRTHSNISHIPLHLIEIYSHLLMFELPSLLHKPRILSIKILWEVKAGPHRSASGFLPPLL